LDTKKTLCRIGQKMKEAGLVAACDGNISFRRDDGTVVITPSGVPKGELKPKHLLVVDLDGHVLEGTGKASSESALHLEIYRKRNDVRAIIHAHPVTATALTVAGIPFRPDIVTEGALVLGPVPTVPYAPPGSAELATACAEAAKLLLVPKPQKEPTSSSWNATAPPPSAETWNRPSTAWKPWKP
jgi:L-fuculose-phosphate aldolase